MDVILIQINMQDNSSVQIVFYDGVCGLCNRFVDFVIRRDHQHIYRFAPLQGKLATEILPEHLTGPLKTIVLKHDEKLYFRSEAGMRILMGLGGAWKLVGALYLFPRFIRDAFYDLVARCRFRIFGKLPACRIPTPEERSLFLD